MAKTHSIAFNAGLLIQRMLWFVSRRLDDGIYRQGDIELTEFSIGLEDLPLEFDGYRIVHISDLHLGSWLNETRLKKTIDRINHLEADLIAITGDFLSESSMGTEGLLEPLSLLQARDGVVAVLGNHDWWTDADRIRAALQRLGIEELGNSIKRVHRRKRFIEIAGLDDVYTEQHDIEKVLEQIHGNRAAVVLVHEPDFADEVAVTGRFQLQLSGHSHGGQFNFPVIGVPFLPRLARKYPRGLYGINGMYLYTSRGLGTTALQMRVRCPAEISVFTLKAALGEEK